jgi:hydrogenase nickel incorporation protein HypA/HybF
VHEVGIAEALIETVERSATETGLRRVRRLNVELGAGAAGLSPSALALALEVVARGTLAEGAEVRFSGPGAVLDAEHAPAHEHADPVDADVRVAWIEGE